MEGQLRAGQPLKLNAVCKCPPGRIDTTCPVCFEGLYNPHAYTQSNGIELFIAADNLDGRQYRKQKNALE